MKRSYEKLQKPVEVLSQELQVCFQLNRKERRTLVGRLAIAEARLKDLQI